MVMISIMHMIMTILPQPFELEQFDYLSRKKDFQKGLVISNRRTFDLRTHNTLDFAQT